MTLYECLRRSSPGRFRVNVEANIDPCRTRVVRDARSPEHCEPCPANPDKKKSPEQPTGSIVITQS